MVNKEIVVIGARQHNLKNITVSIPHGKITVITGLSGSGKSSLAFDTIYAEGQRRYVESLSAYARQFLDRMDKPDVDHIEGLCPAISIEQRTASVSPRSIVATTTEIYDYLRLLYANIGKRHCPRCGESVGKQTPEQIVDILLSMPEGTKFILLAPLVVGRKGYHKDIISEIRKQGFVRVRIDGKFMEIEEAEDIELDRYKAHTIEVVVDRLSVNKNDRVRIMDSVELGLKFGKGTIIAVTEFEGKVREELFSENNSCKNCNISFPELTARHFSFNSPYGACPSCDGLGTELVFDEELIVPDPDLPLSQAIHPWRRGGKRLIIYYKQLLRALAEHYGIDIETPYRELPASFKNILLYGTSEEITRWYWQGGNYRKSVAPFEGVIPNLQRRLETTTSDEIRQKLRSYMSPRLCKVCNGNRLKPEILSCLIAGKSIADVIKMSISEAIVFFDRLKLMPKEFEIADKILKEIKRRLWFLDSIGLGYITLNRHTSSLSGGEAQRIRLATQIGCGLVGVLYVLDEPTIGLHPRDNEKLVATLKELRDIGNTLVIVEHDAYTIKNADHIIDLGPGAGKEGGYVVYLGSVEGLKKCKESLTGRYLNGDLKIPVPVKRKIPDGRFIEIKGASHNNLKNIDVAIPVGLFVCVTGVSGSGKSTLVDDILRKALFKKFYGSKEPPGKYRSITGLKYIDKVVVIDQSPIGRTPRSNPATYIGVFSYIRQLFAKTAEAKIRGYGPGRFSFNVKGGRCEECKGEGKIKLEMHFLPDVYVDCERCSGLRYNYETLQIKYKGKNIAEVLALTVDEALEFFGNIPHISRWLKILSEVGLGYIQLGQPATTLSGGEAQRVKLAAELGRKTTGKTIYLLDEPTTGLHFADVEKLLKILMKLRDMGNTVIVIEHNIDVIKSADYIIDLGPEGGEKGGYVIVSGTPEEVAGCENSYTGQFLRKVLGGEIESKETMDNTTSDRHSISCQV